MKVHTPNVEIASGAIPNRIPSANLPFVLSNVQEVSDDVSSLTIVRLPSIRSKYIMNVQLRLELRYVQSSYDVVITLSNTSNQELALISELVKGTFQLDGTTETLNASRYWKANTIMPLVISDIVVWSLTFTPDDLTIVPSTYLEANLYLY
jgi:hypothetical protein